MANISVAVPKKLVENRVAVTGEHSQVCMYDTYLPEDAVGFSVSELTLCAMITGTKIMHHVNDQKLFRPGESYVLAAGESVNIDFPEARLDQPTKCLTIEISREKVRQVANQLCLADSTYEQSSDMLPMAWHTPNAPQTQALIHKLSHVFEEHSRDRMLVADLAITELVLRLLRQNTCHFVLQHSQDEPDSHGLNAALHLVRKNVTSDLDIDMLCKAACMSRTNLYQKFKLLLNCTPAEFIINTKLEAAARLLNAGGNITEVSYTLGFRHPSHFTRRFKQKFGLSPRQYIGQSAANH
ncbi:MULTISPECIES: AraC family transcriptional regulator [Photobacterium]|uniref:HTH araC/xylS-type domain-containing protein n=1 Tax=Photobacterium ganghwense TaxID=320778 RepID=A0A0J1GY25_9GAMM|nr:MULTISPECIES: AraC family transcriptional regulator [Photobacterium]KLV04570.1 hypothetical protein ABT57_23715 [Photobacterium ganghwense]MBV1841886.1 AraC family transcriptional regulator N-terminal domain-containing protein [Photobacterium ganghwense]PSU09454.1 AraC family transcriptional regulator [Photobacterium ganghwense]QSV16656.1 AraC family transcriptional regulator N-terminal domain-containing protein [Photobacterium ganghwense]